MNGVYNEDEPAGAAAIDQGRAELRDAALKAPVIYAMWLQPDGRVRGCLIGQNHTIEDTRKVIREAMVHAPQYYWEALFGAIKAEERSDAGPEA